MLQVDVFIVQNILPKVFPWITSNTVQQIVEEQLQFPYDKAAQDFAFRQKPPTTKQIVRRLTEIGFSPMQICQFLDINASTVSYHLSTDANFKTYRNPHFYQMAGLYGKKRLDD